MDEVFGYFPPTANPPSKTPMLTLLKQARAFGVGCVLATQNPVDLDYKGLANAGTWFLGRLQTERDKARVMDGLEGAAAASGGAFDRAGMERLLSGLTGRVFLMNNVHEDEPVLFHTRWVLSYLAGPLTREQIGRLHQPSTDAETGMAKTGVAASTATPTPTAVAETASRTSAANRTGASERERPVVPPDIDEQFVAVSKVGPRDTRLLYRPMLLANTTLHFVDAKRDVDEWRRPTFLVGIPDEDESPWTEVEGLPNSPDLLDAPEGAAEFAPLPAVASHAKRYKQWSKELEGALYRERRLVLFKCKALKIHSAPGDSEGDFRARMRETAREQRDLAVEKLRAKYAPKLARLQDQIRTAEERIERERDQYEHRKLDTAISIGSTVLGALFGRKLGSATTVGRATTAMRGAGRAARERGDIGRAQERHEALLAKLADLEAELEDQLASLQGSYDPESLECEQLEIKPRKSDIAVDRLVLAWTPWHVDADGVAEPAC
jgi:hypothetical protein